MSERIAECFCGEAKPSSKRDILPFFEDRGPESAWATEHCKCHAVKEAHQKVNPWTGRAGITDHVFTPRGAAEFDRFYCGCSGWD